MDYKKTNTPLTTVTRDMIELSKDTGNVYETVCVIAQRANQIAAQMKSDLERLPKPTLIATQEYIDHKLFFRKSNKNRGAL